VVADEDVTSSRMCASCRAKALRAAHALTSGRSQRFFEEEAFGLTNLLDGIGAWCRRGREFVEDVGRRAAQWRLRAAHVALTSGRVSPILRGGGGLDELLEGFGAWSPARR
jgi:hypothetical protein